jgi:GNAT superfamily N-acetyltransferase
MPAATSTARLEARISTDLHSMLKRAAELQGRTMTDFVVSAVQDAAQRIAGYYTLASASLLLADLPASTGKKLPRYPTVPAVRMGRLAVGRAFKGQGLGGALLADALDRSARSEIAAYALMVDAKDEAAAAFYQHHGFIALLDSRLTRFLLLRQILGVT